MSRYITLDNGLRLIIDRRDLPTVGVALGVGIGSIYEDPGKRGISHLTEHIIYRSYPNIDLEIEGLGGVSDAYTERTLTMYTFEVIPSELRNLLRLIRKMFGNKRVSREDLERERQVVLSELRMRNDDPGTLIYDLGPRALFGDSDYGDPIIGTEESISSIDTRDIEDFLESYYTPDNMVVSIVGPIDMPIDEVAKMFNGWSGVSKRRKEPTMGKGGPIIVNRHTDSAYLSYSWYVILGNRDPHLLMARSSLLEFHLINGLSSYLISRFRNRGLTYAIDMDRDYLPGVYYYQILISAVNTDMIDKLKEELSAALLNVSNIFTDEHYLNKRFNYFKYLINDYLRRPAQIAESTTYMELKIGMHDVESFNKMLENHFKDDPSDLLSNGVWSMILPS